MLLPSTAVKSLTIIIPKPNKSLYNTPKTFCPIILLNMIEKLIEKVISNRLQAHSIASNFIYPNQLEGIEQHSTTDAGILLTHITNFIQLVYPQPVDRFSQTKLCWKAPNESYPHICGMYKSSNK